MAKANIPTEAQVHDAIEVILSDKASYSKSLNYAVGYCEMSRGMSGHKLYIQVLYILGNISHWRHPMAKAVREILKAFKIQKEEQNNA